MEQPVLVRREGAVAILTLNRPHMRNVLSGEGMVEAIVAATEALNADTQIRAAVLTGAGSAFSAGGDIKRMLARAKAPDPAAARADALAGIQRIPRAFARLEVPIVAAINGPAMGAGLDLACMCDIRMAAASATMAESFIKIGIVPGDGGAWFLPRIVGLPKAIEMSLTGDTLDAEGALSCGLVTKVVPDEELLPAAIAMARRIARHSGPALRLTKSLLQRSQTLRLEEMLDLTAALQAIAYATPEHRAAIEGAVAALGRKDALRPMETEGETS